jgi:hypothetical protein
MFGKEFVKDLIDRSAENEHDRRAFLKTAGLAGLGLGVVGAGAGVLLPSSGAGADDGPSDGAVLNFALNLEYLEAEFYMRAVFGDGLPNTLTSGNGNRGGVVGGRAVSFETRAVRQYAKEIAEDEVAHVQFLRAALGGAKVSRPAIDLQSSFTAAAQAAGLIGPKDTFDPYANENNFLLAAFIFEDVGVTAYKGAAPLIHNKEYLEAAAGILAVEAYHAATIRTVLFERGLGQATNAISKARDSLDGPTDDDQGAKRHGRANITPTDANGIAFSRSAGQVLNVVYLTPAQATKGGFFPHGVNGEINTSDDNS